jgi:hypothetical protein
MMVVAVVHLRTDGAASTGLTGWIEDVATGANTPVGHDHDVVAVLRAMVDERRPTASDPTGSDPTAHD